MEKLTDEFDEEINSLNFDNITKFMKEHDWTWYMGGNLDNCATPTREQMIERLREDFLKHGLYQIIELGKDRFSTFSGGFNLEMGRNGSSYWVHICFDIAHFG